MLGLVAAPDPDPERVGLLGSLILGVVEGLTEFLPVSSTGHLIVTNRLLGHSDPAYEVAIQAGAITAIAVLYWRKLWNAVREITQPGSEGRVNLLVLLVVAALPAAVLGLAFDDAIEAVLFSPTTVATTLIAGGILLLVLERWLARRVARGEPSPSHEVENMTLRHAVVIGLFQCLALVPGTSRSGATIAGALVLGFRRTAAAEFSFLVGLPILYGACVLKIADDWERLTGPMLEDLLVGAAASFVTALVIVRPFVRYLQRHTFAVFAWYRIAAGLALIVLIAAGVLAR